MDRQQYLAVSLPAATASDTRLALAEVQDFAHTDMGRGDGSKWTFRMLDSKGVDDELTRACAPERGGTTESVAFQPCPLHEYRSQDRRVVERWSMPGGTWELTAVFDGAFPSCSMPDRILNIVWYLRTCEPRRGGLCPPDGA